MSRQFQGRSVDKVRRVSLVFFHTSFYPCRSPLVSDPHNIYLGLVGLEQAVVIWSHGEKRLSRSRDKSNRRTTQGESPGRKKLLTSTLSCKKKVNSSIYGVPNWIAYRYPINYLRTNTPSRPTTPDQKHKQRFRVTHAPSALHVI